MNEYEYKLQGDGRHSLICTAPDNKYVIIQDEYEFNLLFSAAQKLEIKNKFTELIPI